MTSTKPKYTMNQFGANYGGKIKKDKAFFFANWERTRRALAETVFQTIPTNPMLTGNFQGISTIIYDPMTGNPDGTGRTPFMNNMIPSNRIASAASYMAALLPAANPAVTALNNNYFAAASANTLATTLTANWIGILPARAQSLAAMDSKRRTFLIPRL